MTTLKEETIKGIQAEGAFNMSDFGNLKKLRSSNRPGNKKFCGTACCVAGHIVAAARRLGRDVPTFNQVHRAVHHFYDCGELPAPFISASQHYNLESDVAIVARTLWARSYGKQSAQALDFYGDGPEMGSYGFQLEDIPAEAAVAHLNRVAKKPSTETV